MVIALYEVRRMSESSLARLFAIFETVVIERLDENSFRVISNLPSWLPRLYPDINSEQDGFMLREQSSFMDDFLASAEDFWNRNNVGRLRSGPWIEMGRSGSEYQLEASAICLGKTKILTIELITLEFEKKRALLQKAREISFANDLLTKELQDKKQMARNIADDMVEPIERINHFIKILDPDKLSAEEKQFLEITKRQALKLEKLAQELMNISTLTKSGKS
jgi:hypothetical protein